jgi:branched-chain amino acid transport system substrate-binding protein
MRRVLTALAIVALATSAFAMLVGFAAASNVSPKATSATKPDIVIGFAIARSGFIEPFDGPAVIAAEIRRDEINKAGGLLGGRKLRFVYADTKSDLQQVANAGIKVINQGAVAMVASCDYDFGAPAAREAEKKKMVTISICAGSPKFGVQGIGPRSYTMGTGTPTEGAAGAQWAFKVKKWRTAYVILDTLVDYNKQYANYFKKHFTKLGGKIVGEDTYKNGDQQVNAQITRLQSTNPKPDFVVLAGIQPGAATVLRQMRAAGLDLPVVGDAAGDGDYWLNAVPGLSDYYFDAYSSVFGDDPNPRINRLVKQYKARTGKQLAGGSFSTGYSVIEALERAIKRAGTTNGDAMKRELDKFRNEPLTIGPTTYTPKVHMPNGRPVRMMQVQDGKMSFLQLYRPTGVTF